MIKCKIINTSQVSLNGSNKAYGGVIQGADFNVGALNGGHRASVTLVSDGSLGSPESGDKFTLGILGMKLKMQVGGFNASQSASSAPTLSLSLYDESNWFLDQNFIQLKEEFPSPTPENVSVIGRKMGPLPDKQLTENSTSLSPNKDTVWGDIRAFFESLKTSAGVFDGGGGNLIGESAIDYYTRSTPGRTAWYTYSDPNKGATLDMVMGHLLSGDKLPNGPFDFTGSFRDVIVQMCSLTGDLAYWDPEENKVMITSASNLGQGNSMNLGQGNSMLATIKSSCKIISTSSTTDFTISRSQGAIGSISSDYPGESFSIFGPKMTRYLRATLVSPEFHYKKCGGDKLIVLEGDGLGKAIAASADPEVFAMYALQSILKKQSKSGSVPSGAMELKMKGKNAKNEIKTNLNDEFDIDGEGISLFEDNNFLADYYVEKGGASLCSGEKTVPVSPSALSFVEKEFNAKAKKWNDKGEQPPRSIVGKWPIKGSQFSDGVLVLNKKHSLSSILDLQGNPNASADILRKYLDAVGNFIDKFYVVPEQTGLRSLKGNSFRHDYGYYMTTDHSSPSSKWEVNQGFKVVSINPFESVTKCAISQIKDLAKVCAMMYVGDGCFDGFLEQIPVVEFIRALDRNELKKLFKSPSSYCRSKVSNLSDLSDKNFDNPTIAMFLVVAEGSSVPGFEDTKTVCFADGIEITSVAKNVVKTLSKLIMKFSFADDTMTGQILATDYKLLGITKQSIGSLIEAQPFESNAPRKVKMWYDVDQSQASIKTSVGHFYMADAKMPAKSKKIWQSSIKSDISVSASDVGLNNGQFSTYLANASNQSDSYSEENKLLMLSALKEKVANNVWSDEGSANNSTVTFALGEGENIAIPNISSGLQSLSLSLRDGLIQVSVTIGDANIRAAKAAMLAMRANNSRLRHSYSSHIPDLFGSIASQRLVSLAKGSK